LCERLLAFFLGERFDFLALAFFLAAIVLAPGETSTTCKQRSGLAWGAPVQASSANYTIRSSDTVKFNGPVNFK
jgi:hypothetical protein